MPTTNFDIAIEWLNEAADCLPGEAAEIRAAIRALEEWPKWERLIEAAGKVDKKYTLEFLQDIDTYVTPRITHELYPLIAALPEKGEK
jgi:hypothetical protein